jgi:hypothetical protein
MQFRVRLELGERARIIRGSGPWGATEKKAPGAIQLSGGFELKAAPGASYRRAGMDREPTRHGITKTVSGIGFKTLFAGRLKMFQPGRVGFKEMGRERVLWAVARFNLPSRRGRN